MSLKKTVVITGASRRLGLFLCERFKCLDYQVVALTRSASDELKALEEQDSLFVEELGEYSEQCIALAIRNIQTKISRVNLLIHNASCFAKDEAYDYSQFKDFFDVHMAMPAQLNTGLREGLSDIQSPGVIVHMTDIYSDNPNQDFALYCASKAGLENLNKSFAKKFAPGIRVNAIQPGPIQFLPEHDEETKEKVLGETLLGFEGGFLPIFQAIMAIVENTYLTGVSIKVDGGRSLGRR